jgi:glycosyltransferase involved in cell wall biosynthesis
MAIHVLYISFTGALEPLGHSQIVRPLIALAARGIRYSLLSLERPAHLEAVEHREHVQRSLEAAGVRWLPIAYAAGGGPQHAASNLGRLALTAANLLREDRPALLHARSYMSAALALAINKLTGIPYIFDTRGFWVDEVREEGHHFVTPASYAAGRAFERQLFTHAAAAVSLSEDGAEVIASGELGPWPAERPLVVIPTCVDYDTFAQPALTPAQRELEAALVDKIVFGYVGSINSSYKVTASIELFRRVHQRDARAHLLAITQQHDAMCALLEAELAPGSWTITSAHHYEMPGMLSLLDWAFLLLKTSPSKRASMPTKLAELFAAGVQPIQHGCNRAVAAWVERAGTGVLLPSLDDDALEEAAQAMLARPFAEPEQLERARQATRAHFSIESAAERYEQLIVQLLSPAAR